MVKAGKRVKRQIRKNKKKPTVQVTKQVAKKRMNVMELMLEKMKMGMLVLQQMQQLTPQQDKQNKEIDKLRNQINVARSKTKALEANLDLVNAEHEEQMRVQKQQYEEIRNKQKEYKKKLKEYERDKRFNETVDDLNDKQEDLNQRIQDDKTIGEMKANYKNRKKQFEREQAEKKAGDEFFEKVDELEYMISRAKDGSEAMEMKKQLAELKNQYEIINHAKAKKQAEIDKNKYITQIQIQKDANEQAEAELRALNETLESKAYTNSLEVYKESCKKQLQLEDDIRLKKQQLENEKQIQAEQMKYEAQREYWYGTEQQRRQRGFISDGQKIENALQKSVVKQMNAITSLKIQNDDVVYKAEQLNALEDQLEGATRNKAKLEAEQWRAKAMVKENKDKFDENGNLILTEEEKKTFEDEAKAKSELDIQNQRLEIQKSKMNIERERTKGEFIEATMKDMEHINQINDIQRQIEKTNEEAEVQRRKNIILEQQKKLHQRRALEEARFNSTLTGTNRHVYSVARYDQKIGEVKAFMHQQALEDDEYEKLINQLYPFMSTANDEIMERVHGYLVNTDERWADADFREWLEFSNSDLNTLKHAIRQSDGTVMPLDNSVVTPQYDKNVATSEN